LASVDEKGWPYVVPLVYIGVEDRSVSQGKRFACDSALLYPSVITVGSACILYHDRANNPGSSTDC
jgi:hypothetical protein